MLSCLKKKIISLFSLICYCFSIAWNASPKYTLIRMFSSILLPLFGFLQSYLTKLVLDILTGKSFAETVMISLFSVIVMLLMLTMVITIVEKLSSYAQKMHSDIVRKHLIEKLIIKAMDLSLDMFDNPKFYDQINLVQGDCTALIDILWDVIDMISYLTAIVSSLLIISKANILFGLMILVTSVPAAIVMHKYTRDLYNLDIKQINEVRNQTYSVYLATSREYAQDIRLFDISRFITNRYCSIWIRLFHEKRNLIKKETVVSTILLFLPDVALSVSYMIIAVNILKHLYTVGDFSYFGGVLIQLSSYSALLIQAVMTIYENELKINNIRLFFNLKNTIIDEGKELLSFINDIEFHNVDFSYPGTERKVLKNVSFQIKSGDKVAIVGTNGSGKTTITKLLLRFYDPKEGEIKINGKNIKNYTIASLRRCFSAYLQNDPAFGFTLRENVKISESEKVCEDSKNYDKEVISALYKSGADAILKKCGEKGLDAYITRMFNVDGIELSGGEEQKLSLAKTFFRDCSALILDEPSSSLDPEAENDIFQKLVELCKGKTVLFTSHRLSNLSLADRIIVMEDGCVIEEGTREELLRKKSRFAQLYDYQAQKYR